MKTLRDSQSGPWQPEATKGATQAASSLKTELARAVGPARPEAHMKTQRGSGTRPGEIPLVAADTRLSRHQVLTVRLSQIRPQARSSMYSLRGCLVGAPKAALAALHTALAVDLSCSSTDMHQGGGRIALKASLNLLQQAGSLRDARSTPSTFHWVPRGAHLMARGTRSSTKKWSSQSPAESTT